MRGEERVGKERGREREKRKMSAKATLNLQWPCGQISTHHKHTVVNTACTCQHTQNDPQQTHTCTRSSANTYVNSGVRAATHQGAADLLTAAPGDRVRPRTCFPILIWKTYAVVKGGDDLALKPYRISV